MVTLGKAPTPKTAEMVRCSNTHLLAFKKCMECRVGVCAITPYRSVAYVAAVEHMPNPPPVGTPFAT